IRLVRVQEVAIAERRVRRHAGIVACRILMRLGEGYIEPGCYLVMQAARIEGLRRIAVEADAAFLEIVAAGIISERRRLANAGLAGLAHDILPIEDGVGIVEPGIVVRRLEIIIERDPVTPEIVDAVVLSWRKGFTWPLRGLEIGIDILVVVLRRQAEG